MERIYLDNAATTRPDPRVLDELYQFLDSCYGNPSSIHSHGREAKAKLETARKTVANLLKVAPGEIFFTSGGTEADNMAIRCAVHDLGVKHIISSPIEHHAVLHTCEEMAESGAAELHLVNLDEKGHLDYRHLEELIHRYPGALVSLMYGNNEIGNLLQVNRVAQLCEATGSYFHCDTVQAIGHYEIHPAELGIHFLAASAHKFNGPKGIGFIYVKGGVKIKPILTGGAQERNMRGGTENIGGIVALAKALEISCAEMERKHRHILGLKQHMINRLKAEIPGVTFNGDAEGESLYTVLNVSFPANDINEMLLYRLDIDGISASGGSACSSGSNKGSHVLNTLGIEPSRANVRFSFGKFNTIEEIDRTIQVLQNIYAKTPLAV